MSVSQIAAKMGGEGALAGHVGQGHLIPAST